MVNHILQVKRGILVKPKELDNKYKKIFDTMTKNENFMEKIEIVFSPMPGIDTVDFCLFPINDKD